MRARLFSDPHRRSSGAIVARLVALAVVLCLPTLVATADEPASQPSAALCTTPDAYIAHVRYLASDELEGRQPGTPGIEKAAEYVAKQFEAAGLSPGGVGATWFQELTVVRGKKIVDSDAKLAFAKTESLPEAAGDWKPQPFKGLDADPKLGVDWTPLPFTDMADVDGPLAFAGYGIKADEFSYNDYADFDADGKILLVFRYEPRSQDESAEFGGKDPSRYAEFRSKAFTAARRGAKALLIVNPPHHEGTPPGLYKFTEEMSRQTFDIPVAQISTELAEKLLAAVGSTSLAKLQDELDQERKPLSRDLGINVTLHPGVRKNEVKTRNVLGLLKGDGSTEDTIVVGAHYDHLGNVPRQFERENDEPQIHNGADDDASGTAAVIELARVLGKERGLKRNVLFIAFTAEEMGLLGSRYWVANPTLPLSNVRAMVNFDMVGRLKQDQFTIFGVFSAAEFEPLVRDAAERLGLSFKSPKMLIGNADHASFLANEIPFLFPFTGMHRQYHRPEDDADLIDADGGAKIVTMFHDVIVALANMSAGPKFVSAKHEGEADEDLPRPAYEEAERQRESGASKPPDGAHDARSPGGSRVRLGIVPDYSNDAAPGLLVQSVVEGGPAKAAGIQANDRIVRINEKPVKDIYGYMAAMKELRPGNEIAVTVTREGKEQTIKIKLPTTTRPSGRE